MDWLASRWLSDVHANDFRVHLAFRLSLRLRLRLCRRLQLQLHVALEQSRQPHVVRADF